MHIQTARPTDSLPSVRMPTPLTPYTLTLLLAYLHYYTPELLPRGHFIAPTHLRIMAQWIDRPSPKLRSIRQHPFLAAHIALLQSAGFIPATGPRLIPLPAVTNWLHASFSEQVRRLLVALDNSSAWQETLSHLGMEETITEDLTVYLHQLLERQLAARAPDESGTACWLPETNGDAWALRLPDALPLWLHFDLRQFGEWSPDHPLLCTPLTIAKAAQRGYGEAAMQWILETATGQPLPEERQKQLATWSRRAHTFQLQTARLLTTAQHQQLKAIIRQKRLRESVVSQISPHHALVTGDMLPKLEKWLATQGYPLRYSAAESGEPGSSKEKSAEYYWLGLRILTGLRELFPLPYPAPHALLEDAAQSLPPETIADLEHLAQQTLESLRQAVRGRDAFFPSERPVPDTWLEMIQQAIYAQTPLTLCYQALGERKPSWREVQPLRLEEKGDLYYLYVYCHRAEANLTLRLDRVREIEI
jgi:hypothetical protein